MTTALSTSTLGVTRMTLSDALALGPAVWETLEQSAATPSPFMSWAWYRAWADSGVGRADVAQSEVLALRNAVGRVAALLPLRLQRVLYHRVPVSALTWAAGDVGCPDHLDLLAMRGADEVRRRVGGRLATAAAGEHGDFEMLARGAGIPDRDDGASITDGAVGQDLARRRAVGQTRS